MPTSFRVDPTHGVVHAETRGPTSSMDIITSIAALLDHPSYTPGLRVLFDMREVVPSLHRSDVLRIAQYVKAHEDKLRGVKLAVVATKASTFGMAQEQKVALTGSPVEMEVFREMDDAREWLGVPSKADEASADAAAG